MYENFTLKKTGKGIISGYIWKVDNPKKVVCIVHGIGEYGGRYDRMATAFAKAEIAVLSMDLRGHGNSVNARGHCWPRKEVLKDISDLILYAGKVYPGKDIIVYGHSMGGNLVLDYINRGTENDIPSKYIVSAPWVRLVNPISSGLLGFCRVACRFVPQITVGSTVDEASLGHPDTVRPYKSNPMVHDRISIGCAVDGMDTGKAIEEGTLESNGKASDTPVLLMHGTADRICDIEGTRRVYENMKEKNRPVKFIEWPEYFHEIHNGNRETRGDEVIKTAIDFALE